ncbi:hypothetical protein RV12_GL002142 [Enterococcus quebecensis]|nr:hypothetical protein RV12_GL002142 [Enterococcus quebecensis]
MLIPSTASAAGTAYYVKAVIPENQLDNTEDYFNIGTTATINQTIELLITNESDENKTMELALLDGMTTKDGAISYDIDHKYDKSQRYKFSQVASVEQKEITVNANSTQQVKVLLKSQTDNFDGTILGAVNIHEKEDEEQPAAGLNNVFAYNIPVKIRVNKENKNIQLNYKGMVLAKNPLGKAIDMSFENPMPNIIRDLNLSFEIYKQGKPSDILYKDHKSGVEIAPNSLFSPELSLASSKLKAGDYVLKIVGKSKDIDAVWESDFSISRSDSGYLNEGLEVLSNNNRIWVILAVVITLMVVGGASYVFYKRKK